MLKQKNIEYLKSILGSQNVYSDKPHLISYSYDALRLKYKPEAVVFPKEESQVSKILKYCNENKITITPRGAGTGYTGGALPITGGIVISFEKYMNKILEIDIDNMVAIVQPGVLNIHLQEEVAKHNLFYPPDPASWSYSTIGGNISENAGGMRAAKYGVTKDYVLALRAVLPNGDIICAGKKTIKDVAGYNLVGILVGSEGTLAVITQATLKLVALTNITKTLIALFNTVKSAMEAVYKIMASGMAPRTMEFLDNLTIKALNKINKNKLPSNVEAMLIIDIDADVDSQIKYKFKKIKEIAQKSGSCYYKEAHNQKESDDIWAMRRNASISLGTYGTKKINEDVTVPRKNLPMLLEEIKKISKEYGVKIPCFGHAGDGNVHVNVMVDKNSKDELKRGFNAIKDVLKITVSLEGTLSGEHGIGISKASFMDLAFSQKELRLFKNIKNTFDPNNILNPNKMGI